MTRKNRQQHPALFERTNIKHMPVLPPSYLPVEIVPVFWRSTWFP
jgi:hypothetical protein